MDQQQYILAITNRKGGTGKTTTAVNLAAMWSNKGYKTLVLDLDPQGHTSIGLGGLSVKPKLHNLFLGNAIKNLDELIDETPHGNLWLGYMFQDFNPKDAIHSEALLGERLRLLIEKSDFQRIVIDTPPTLDTLLLSGLLASDGVVVPFIPDHLAEVGVKQIIRVLYRLSTSYSKTCKLLGLLPVMTDNRKNLHKRVLGSMTTQFGKRLMLRGVRNNVSLAEAFEAGAPVLNYAPKSRGAMDYQLLAEELATMN